MPEPEEVNLLQEYTGYLVVKIKDEGEICVGKAQAPFLDFILSVHGFFIGECLSNGRAEDWKVLNFSPEEGILEVEKIG